MNQTTQPTTDPTTDPKIRESLGFQTLTDLNNARQAHFKNRNGEPIDCSTWSTADWFMAVTGELGEAANIAKKVNRGDLSLIEARESIAFELADVVIYVDLLATHLGINLGQAVLKKWNLVSERLGLAHRLHTLSNKRTLRCEALLERWLNAATNPEQHAQLLHDTALELKR